ncbi:UbiA-like polyprenyltransferase, partial [uncultured Meiothermus sp.]|uniref:UbiA-like polyprenyltransferase n=1 Tax=uncultured Meiothermus sp. TaxID=157471 RepID=UPI002624F90D
MVALTSRLKTYFELVRFEHTLFALPFAYGGMLLAAKGWPGWEVFGWITVAMVGARTSSMALNRLIDQKIDAVNPRTAKRHLPRGVVKPLEVLVLAVVGLLGLVVAAFNLNPLTAQLLPVAVFFLVGYSYTKRFTWLCHFWLGLTIGAATAGGWIAVTGAFEPALF